MVKIHKFVTSTLGLRTLAPLRSFYVYIYTYMPICVRIVFDNIGETAIIPLENHRPFLADG